jgi:hypothetical protein
MTKKYNVNIKRIDYGFIEINAKNKKEAKKKAYELEEEGEVMWNNSETKVTNVFDNECCIDNKKSKT